MRQPISDTALNLKQAPGLALVISGPSGVGKTTLCQKLLETYSGSLARAITTTSRPMRPGEVEGKDYYFISPTAFEKGIQDKLFYEYAKVYDQWKGVYRKELQEKLDSGVDVLLNVDVQGAETYRGFAQADAALQGKLFTIFVVPPSFEDLRDRMIKRGGMDAKELEARIQEAKAELSHAPNFDYRLRSTQCPEEDFRQLKALYAALKIRQRHLWKFSQAGS